MHEAKITAYFKLTASGLMNLAYLTLLHVSKVDESLFFNHILGLVDDPIVVDLKKKGLGFGRGTGDKSGLLISTLLKQVRPNIASLDRFLERECEKKQGLSLPGGVKISPLSPGKAWKPWLRLEGETLSLSR